MSVKSLVFNTFSSNFEPILTKNFRNFAEYLRKCWESLKFQKFSQKFWWIFLDSDRILTEFWCEKSEWFDRSPIEPFELFTSEFGQNSVRIQENSSKIFRKFLKIEKLSTFSKVFSKIPRNFRQNRCKIRWKSIEI